MVTDCLVRCHGGGEIVTDCLVRCHGGGGRWLQTA